MSNENPPPKSLAEIEKKPQSIQSVAVGAALLSVLAKASEALPLSVLAERAAMAPAKAHRYLAGYIFAGLIVQEAGSGRYDLGPLALDLGLAALRRLDLLTLAQPIMTQLRNEVGQTVSLTIWANRGPTIIRWVDSLAPVTISVSVGSVLPILTSSNGRIFLTYLPHSVTNALIARELREAQEQKNSLAAAQDIDKLRKEVEGEGLAQGNGMVLPGICSISAPIFRFDGTLAGSLTVLGVQGVLDISTKGVAAVCLKRAAQNLSERMGARAP